MPDHDTDRRQIIKNLLKLPVIGVFGLLFYESVNRYQSWEPYDDPLYFDQEDEMEIVYGDGGLGELKGEINSRVDKPLTARVEVSFEIWTTDGNLLDVGWGETEIGRIESNEKDVEFQVGPGDGDGEIENKIEATLTKQITGEGIIVDEKSYYYEYFNPPDSED